MKKTTGIILAFVCLLAFSAYAYAEKQPRMNNTIELLEEAAHQLEHASPDKGGHRARALKLIHEAIDEVEAGIRYDNRHGHIGHD